ncbi:carbohydrate ABC transporter permease [Paenibacillus silviterrae]|uniref:carbohydrate ABC transporter permease n=1 Tax=Paenibacillus silviterrae TaxID=3242194 RepID=UPI002543A3D6|nr:carbohydrate ABC transporter permease [Paenibacillus chinjuensis]
MRRGSSGYRLFLRANNILLFLLSLVMFLPMVNIVAKSFSDSKTIEAGRVGLFPVDFSLTNYEFVLMDTAIWRSFGITVYITAVGTLINLIMTAMLAYPLSRQEFVGRKYVLLMVLFTMIFSAPLIPNFLLIRQLGLMDSLWALLLPGAVSAFNFFVMRSFFLQIPIELIDSSRIDGCGETRILWNIIVPLSKPAMATVGIFYGVTHWNTYQSAIYYINDKSLQPLQVKLREMIVSDNMNSSSGAHLFDAALLASPEGIKMATIVVATLPIIAIYPFLQRYFIKGMMLGSVKA